MRPTGETDREFFARLIALADTLVSGLDVVDVADRLVHTCLEFLPITSAGIMLSDQRGGLRVLACTDEETRHLELLELQSAEGPCLEAFSSGEVVVENDLAGAVQRWPVFAAAASDLQISAAYALPLQLRTQTIGALNLFCSSSEGLGRDQIHIAHMMSTMATLGILNHWSVRRAEVVAEQLQAALSSRIVIEQAKGVIAERSGVTMGRAFDMLRAAARTSRRPLSDVAGDVARGRRVLDDAQDQQRAPDEHTSDQPG